MTIQDAMNEATLRFPGLTPEDINSGLCFEWARIVFDLVEGSKIAGHNVCGWGHSYIEYADHCYDAECLMGVDDWQQLSFFVRTRCWLDVEFPVKRSEHA